MKTVVSNIIKAVTKRLGRKITIQLLIVLSICACISIAFFNLNMSYVNKITNEYDKKSEIMLIDGYNLSAAIQNESINSGDTDKIEILVDKVMAGKPYKVILTDPKGKMLYPSNNAVYAQETAPILTNEKPIEKDMMTDKGLYAVKLNDTVLKLSIISSDNTNWIVKYNKNGMIPGVMAFISIIIFIFLFFLLTRRKIRYLEELASGIKKISGGNLDYRIGVSGNDELALVASELNFMACELKDYFEREKNLEKSKSELIINVSHDLKSPLTAVIGYLSLLNEKKYDGDDAMSDYIERAYQKSLRIKGFLQELLDFTSLTSEDTKLNKQYISLNNLLEQLIGEYMSIFEQNRLQVIKRIDCDDIYVNVDPDQIIRVFENLLSNSLRYSPKPGEIRISLEKRLEGPVFSISNKCEEIKCDELEKLFEKFYRLEKSRSEKTGGTGLGLAIAKRIADLHGGKIWAEYEADEITFFVAFQSE